ncbi:MAG: phosphate butyryltransferase [Bacteroidales bacterium]|nr:phosphate butyryltransferase [Bacteroidales bacterium]
MITNFDQMFEQLRSKPKKRLVAAWGVDDHTISAVYMAVEAGIVEGILVGDEAMIQKVCSENNYDIAKLTVVNNPNELKSIAQAVDMVNAGEADILMKGLCSTDKYMRGILNKEKGLLPPKAVLSHVCVVQNPGYHKLLVISDIAVIPAPDFKQKQAMIGYVANTAKALGIDKPKVAMVTATEQMLVGMPACVEAAMLAKMSDRGQIAGCGVDGPLALDVALCKEAAEIKKLKSEVAGDADCLVFPSIEAANVFYKLGGHFIPGVKMAAMVAGAKAPCVLSSRADSTETKLNSIALAALTAK